MSLSVFSPYQQGLERHTKRLGWFALLACIALLVPTSAASIEPELQLAGALAAVVVVVAVWSSLRAVARYIRAEQVSRREATDASVKAGACLAANAIQDRVANLLSVTVGYVEFMVEDERLPSEVRERGEKALEGALAAAHAVSSYRQALECEAQTAAPWLYGGAEQQLTALGRKQPTRLPVAPDFRWTYDRTSRRVVDAAGAEVASVSPTLDRATASAAGRFLAAAPSMWSALGEAQELAVSILVDQDRNRESEEQLRRVLDAINDITGRLQG
jgi:hypothetical protein